jgi:hypothetical protein
MKRRSRLSGMLGGQPKILTVQTMKRFTGVIGFAVFLVVYGLTSVLRGAEQIKHYDLKGGLREKKFLFRTCRRCQLTPENGWAFPCGTWRQPTGRQRKALFCSPTRGRHRRWPCWI